MDKPTLLILAAGMGSRYGGTKQIDHFGPNGETIIDYSIYDALNAGFDKVVFIIRESFAEEFKHIFDEKLGDKDVEIEYIYQELDSFLGNRSVPENREKPWGTAHAVLCAKNVINEPFAVINADDFYGKEPFERMGDFLNNECSENRAALMGYDIENTLSEHGTVSRGVCATDDQGNLNTITERTKVTTKEDRIVYIDEQGNDHKLPAGTPVSMNFWGFDPSIFNLTEQMFHHFLEENIEKPTAEFLIPSVADRFIAQDSGSIKVIPTSEQWFGVTYRKDASAVKESLKQLIDKEIYPENLWA